MAPLAGSVRITRSRATVRRSTASVSTPRSSVPAFRAASTRASISPRYSSKIAFWSATGKASRRFHGRDTYGVGAANVLAAHAAGVRVFDASVQGLGGCPFAPGATGDVATENLVWMLETTDVPTDIELSTLEAAGPPEAGTGGRVRGAPAAR